MTALLSTKLLNAQGVGAGSTIQTKLEISVTTEFADTGDLVSVRVERPLHGKDGTLIPAGSRFRGRVDFVQRKSMTEDGWMRLIFNQIELPDGREFGTLASASFHTEAPKPKRDYILGMAALGTAGALLVGPNKRLAGGLGGAIVGMVIAENRHSEGRDLVLRAGQTIRLRLNQEIASR
jgi:hypothetical protein